MTLRQFLTKRFFIDIGDPTSTILLVGSARSGTTWMQGILNCRNDHRILFEPFNSRRVPAISGWRYRQYIRGSDESRFYKTVAQSILTGRIRYKWIDKYNTKFIASKRIIKDIRIPLSLWWLHKNWPSIPIIFLVRHPLSVIKSKLALDWSDELDEFISQKQFVDDYLQKHDWHSWSEANSFDRHLIQWCLENFVPLCQFDNLNMLVVFYEDLCTRPFTEVERIFDYLKRPPPDLDLVQDVVTKPSATSRKESAVQKGLDFVDGWQHEPTDMDTRNFERIMESFGLDILYGRGPYPLVKADSVLSVMKPTR